MIRGLKKFDGKDPAEFKTWMKKFCVVLGVTTKDILPLLKKQRKPDPADTAAFDSYTRANENLYAILFLLVELPAALSIQKHEDDTGISGDGQAAFEELCNNYDRGFPDEYKDVKLMVFRDPTFNVLAMQSTERNMFLDEQSRKGLKRRTAATSRSTSGGTNCPKIKNRAKKKAKPAGATKWCSKHSTTSHSDEECYQQGGKRPEDTKDSRRNFAASSTGVGLLIGTGASETMFDNRLIPDGNLHDYTQRNSPKIVDVAGESQLTGTATGILHCTVKDNRGQQLRVRIQGLVVPGLGRNIFSPTSLLKKGSRCVVEESTPHLTIQGKVIPLTQDPRDQGMCTLDITFEQNVQPSGTKSLVPHQKQS
ncbi:unnamed protein product [Ectocarpus sp. CCAP 1310/34]|nr:unnamed protein product [Ectocarpus sp. CCAP 1310/34]